MDRRRVISRPNPCWIILRASVVTPWSSPSSPAQLIQHPLHRIILQTASTNTGYPGLVLGPPNVHMTSGSGHVCSMTLHWPPDLCLLRCFVSVMTGVFKLWIPVPSHCVKSSRIISIMERKWSVCVTSVLWKNFKWCICVWFVLVVICWWQYLFERCLPDLFVWVGKWVLFNLFGVYMWLGFSLCCNLW